MKPGAEGSAEEAGVEPAAGDGAREQGAGPGEAAPGANAWGCWAEGRTWSRGALPKQFPGRAGHDLAQIPVVSRPSRGGGPAAENSGEKPLPLN